MRSACSAGRARKRKNLGDCRGSEFQMVRARGLEPPWGCPHTDLNRTRLPIPPRPQSVTLHQKRFVIIPQHQQVRKGNFPLFPIRLLLRRRPRRAAGGLARVRFLRTKRTCCRIVHRTEAFGRYHCRKKTKRSPHPAARSRIPRSPRAARRCRTIQAGR